MPQQITDSREKCLNCGTNLQGNFCTECGQPENTSRISFKSTINEFLSTTFALEGPLLLTIKLLIINPGKVFREYIDGKRRTYYKPVAFFVLVTAVYLILRAAINYDPLAGESISTDTEDLSIISSHGDEALRLMADNISKIMFLLVFSIALMLKLFFRKKYNLAEYTSIGLFITGMYTVFKTITMFISKFLFIGIEDAELTIAFILISYSTYSLFCLHNFWAIIKYLLVGSFSLLFYILFGLGFFFLIVYLR